MGHWLVVCLAREDLERAVPPEPGTWAGPAGPGTWGGPDDASAAELAAARDRFQRVCRSLGVALAPSAPGLERLDRYVYRPLRDAAYLAARLLQGEVYERAQLGVPLDRAFDDVVDSWVEDFGTLLVDAQRLARRPDSGLLARDSVPTVAVADGRPHPPYAHPPHLVVLQRAKVAAVGARERAAASGDPGGGRELRMHKRREVFSSCDADFLGPGGSELVRVVFVTVSLLRDNLASALRRNGAASGTPYQRVTDRFRRVTAKLVSDAEGP